MKLLEYAKDECSQRRYNCINLLPKETVEFRIFRGTLKTNTILTSLKFLNCVCELMVNHAAQVKEQLTMGGISPSAILTPGRF